MILGTGIDIIEVTRIAASFEKFGERFVNRILLPDEITYCLSHKNPAPFLAVRFAAKEALFKALGTGWAENTAFNEVEIINDDKGKPEITLSGVTKDTIEKMGVKNVQVSLTHIKSTASAVVIIEK